MQVETVEQMLFLCPWVEPVWFGGVLNCRTIRQEINTLDAWFSKMIERYFRTKNENRRFLTYIAFTCYSIFVCYGKYEKHDVVRC